MSNREKIMDYAIVAVRDFAYLLRTGEVKLPFYVEGLRNATLERLKTTWLKHDTEGLEVARAGVNLAAHTLLGQMALRGVTEPTAVTETFDTLLEETSKALSAMATGYHALAVSYQGMTLNSSKAVWTFDRKERQLEELGIGEDFKVQGKDYTKIMLQGLFKGQVAALDRKDYSVKVFDGVKVVDNRDEEQVALGSIEVGELVVYDGSLVQLVSRDKDTGCCNLLGMTKHYGPLTEDVKVAKVCEIHVVTE